MTIIEPNKNKYYTDEILYLMLFIITGAVLSIYFYNLNVNLRYNISLQEKSLQKLEVLNADLRNRLYQILDSKNLADFVQKQNLVSDKNPDYMSHENKPLVSR